MKNHKHSLFVLESPGAAGDLPAGGKPARLGDGHGTRGSPGTYSAYVK